MTALAVDTPRTVVGEGIIKKLPLKAGVTCFAGSILQWDTTNGGVAPYASGTSGFAGIAMEGGANTTANHAGVLGDIYVDVLVKGEIKYVISATIALTSLAATLYAASDDNTVNLTSTSNLPIGKVTRVVTAGASGANEVEALVEAAGFTSV